MFLTITGKPGSGKSTICAALADKYGFQAFSSGTIQRDIATDMGISTLDLNKLMVIDSTYDRLIDKKMIQRARKRQGENVVFDSRMAFRLVSDSFDIFTTIDPWEAAKKVMEMSRGDAEIYDSLESAKQSLSERGRIENERFQKLYGVDTFDYSNFNLVVDTTWSDRNEIAELIYTVACSEPDRQRSRILISPRSLYPTETIEKILDDKELIKADYGKKNQILHSVRIREYHYVIGEQSHIALLMALKEKRSFVEIQCITMDGRLRLDTQKSLFQKLQHSDKKLWRSYEEWGDFQYKSYPHLNI